MALLTTRTPTPWSNWYKFAFDDSTTMTHWWIWAWWEDLPVPQWWHCHCHCRYRWGPPRGDSCLCLWNWIVKTRYWCFPSTWPSFWEGMWRNNGHHRRRNLGTWQGGRHDVIAQWWILVSSSSTTTIPSSPSSALFWFFRKNQRKHQNLSLLSSGQVLEPETPI